LEADCIEIMRIVLVGCLIGHNESRRKCVST
jgi:hypothetical protein